MTRLGVAIIFGLGLVVGGLLIHIYHLKPVLDSDGNKINLVILNAKVKQNANTIKVNHMRVINKIRCKHREEDRFPCVVDRNYRAN